MPRKHHHVIMYNVYVLPSGKVCRGENNADIHIHANRLTMLQTTFKKFPYEDRARQYLQCLFGENRQG